MSIIRKSIEWPANVLNAIAGGLAVLMMLHIVADVFSKYVLNTQIVGTIETVSGYYMVAIVFFPLAHVAHRDGHIMVELFTRLFSRRTIRFIDGVVGVGTFALMSVFAWVTTQEAVLRTKQGEVWETGATIIAIWPSRWFIPIGSALMAIYALYHLIMNFRGKD